VTYRPDKGKANRGGQNNGTPLVGGVRYFGSSYPKVKEEEEGSE